MADVERFDWTELGPAESPENVSVEVRQTDGRPPTLWLVTRGVPEPVLPREVRGLAIEALGALGEYERRGGQIE